MAPSRTPPTRGLGDLRRGRPADETMRNLLELLSGKLELCARLPVLELEANREGHEDVVKAFRELAEAERDSIERLKQCLLAELAATTDVPDRGRRPQ